MNDGKSEMVFVSIAELAIAVGVFSKDEEEFCCGNCGHKLHWLKDFDSAALYAGAVEVDYKCPACGIINSKRGRPKNKKFLRRWQDDE